MPLARRLPKRGFKSRNRVEFATVNVGNLAALEACAESLGVTLPVHVEVDLGMSRGGAHPDEASRMVRAIHTSRRLELRGIFGHFSHSRSDAARTETQMATYESLVEANRRFMPADAYEHVASTYALARGRNPSQSQSVPHLRRESKNTR